MNRGFLLYLSAAMPESEEHAAAAEEAIISLSRAVCAVGGRLLVNPEDDIVTLVALVAAEYAMVEPEEEEQEPGDRRARHPPLVVLGRPWEDSAADEARMTLARFGYLEPSRPEERLEWMARAGAMVSIGRQDRRDWEDFHRSGSTGRPVVSFPSTGAEDLPGADRAWDGPFEEVEVRFERWMAARREAGREWGEFGEPLLAEARWPLVMQGLVMRLSGG